MQHPYTSTDAPVDDHRGAADPELVAEHPLGAGADVLAAVVDRLIPADELGPGAVDAGVLNFFERQLTGPLAHLTDLYAQGLAELDDLARAERGVGFTDLSPEQQDDVLHLVEHLDPAGDRGRLKGFFEAVLNHTIDGFLADPVYGGNREFLGWQLIGYPGPELQPTVEQQSIGHITPLNRKSRDDFGFFSATAPAKAL